MRCSVPGPVVFEHACKLGCEGIVSKRRGSRYARGRTLDWLKVKNSERRRCSGKSKSIGADRLVCRETVALPQPKLIFG
jgi:hypothetical protein